MKTERFLRDVSQAVTWHPVPDNWLKSITPGQLNLYLLITQKPAQGKSPELPPLTKAFYLGFKKIRYRGEDEAISDIAGVLRPESFKEQIYRTNRPIFDAVYSQDFWTKAFRNILRVQEI